MLLVRGYPEGIYTMIILRKNISGKCIRKENKQDMCVRTYVLFKSICKQIEALVPTEYILLRSSVSHIK